jgi:hypothetical protein
MAPRGRAPSSIHPQPEPAFRFAQVVDFPHQRAATPCVEMRANSFFFDISMCSLTVARASALWNFDRTTEERHAQDHQTPRRRR